MGARDVVPEAARPDEVAAFGDAGRTLFSLGLVRGTEGNLSTFDGARLVITRAGSSLLRLGPGDVLAGSDAAPPEGASSDLAVHLALYRGRGPGAVAHAHPAGTVPQGWVEGQPHGRYGFALTLGDAVGEVVRTARREAGAAPGSGGGFVKPVEWRDGVVRILDQTRLPEEEVVLECREPSDVAGAIRRLAIRGAPAIGVAAAMGLALAAERSAATGPAELLSELEREGAGLVATRPTAVNLAWAIGRVLAAVRGAASRQDARGAALDAAIQIAVEDEEACVSLSKFGQELVPERANVLTHCNTGMLCTMGPGTALGIVYAAHEAGKRVHVWVDETRPVLQGARLTAWELRRMGVPMTLVPDAAAGHLMAGGKVDLVVVGADRIAANGDVANKIGTYGLAVLARHHRVPFYVAAPTSSIDLSTQAGTDIRIEERDPEEVTSPRGVRFAPEGTPAHNPAFDVTPARLVTAIVTETGVLRPPYRSALRRAVRDSGGGR